MGDFVGLVLYEDFVGCWKSCFLVILVIVECDEVFRVSVVDKGWGFFVKLVCLLVLCVLMM